jgi:N-acetyl-D-muramate 6-phosphate phosphatase
MEELLQKLEDEKLPWGIVTNKQKRFTVPLTEQMGLMQRAHCVVSGDTTPFLQAPSGTHFACRYD